jgi:hypothetical protein
MTTATLVINGKPVASQRPRITTVMTLVTPSMAEEWLEKNNEGNRNLRKGDVEALRNIIEQRLWEPTHQGIAFYDDDTVADGQHRLTAIVQAGISVWVNVTTGLPRRAIHAIDGGTVRTKLDRLHFSGVKSDSHRVSTCNLLIQQFKAEEAGRDRWTSNKIPSQEFETFYSKFLPAIEWVLSFKRLERSQAPLTAAVAAAWFTQDRDRLAEFMAVMHSGETSGPRDRAAIRLRDHINQGKYGAGSPARNDLFLRCCGALRYFIAGQPLSKLYATVDHAFPLVGPLASIEEVT